MKTILAFACLCLGVVTLAAQTSLSAEKAESPADALKKTIEHPYITGSLKDALASFGKLTGVKVVADWDAIKSAGVKDSAAVSIRAPQATAEQVLELILSQAATGAEALAWYADSESIHVSTQMRVLYRNMLAGRPLSPARERTSGSSGADTPAARSSMGRETIKKIDLRNMTLEEAVSFFRQASGANITVNWKSLEELKIDRTTQVTLEATDITVAQAMDLVLDQLNTGGKDRLSRAYWVIDEGVVVIASGTFLNQKTFTRVFDVSENLMTVPNFQGPRMDISNFGQNAGTGQSGSSGGAGGGGGNGGGMFTATETKKEDEQSPGAARKELAEGLMGAVKDSIGADMWQPTGPGSIRILRGQMIITQSLLGFKLLQVGGTTK